MTNNQQNTLILIVDDIQQNLQVLGNMLRKKGYNLAFAQNGTGALDFVKKKQPSLILLDITMPDMSGFEVCKRLKQDSALSEIPVIFLTAKVEKEDVIEGLELGAVDYVTKPFNTRELVRRVETHLELKAARDIILSQKEELKQNVAELKHLNATKDKFFSIISHDLKELFNALMGLSGLLAENRVDANRRENFIKLIQQTSEQGYDLLKNLLEWAKLQTGEMAFEPAKFNLKDIIAEYVELSKMLAKAKNINIIFSISDSVETSSVFVDKNMLDTVLRNLLSNAIKFTPTNGTVEIYSQKKNNLVEISISDTGIGIKPQNIDKRFRIDGGYMSIGTSGEKCTGLSLMLCKEFIEKNGGSLWVESEEGKGSRFYISFPVQDTPCTP
jgi:signal transduction histidine kinase